MRSHFQSYINMKSLKICATGVVNKIQCSGFEFSNNLYGKQFFPLHFLLITEIASCFSLQTSKCYLQFLYFQFILYVVAKLIFLEHKSVTPLQIKPIVSHCQRNKLKTISLLLSATIIWLQPTFPLRSGLPIQRIGLQASGC